MGFASGWLRASLAVATLACAACGLIAGDDVRARVEGGQLVVENRSGLPVHVHAAPPGASWLAASLPGNSVADKGSRRLRILPSQRGQVLELSWWRPGARIGGSEIRGADRIRRLRVDVPPPVEPPADDEVLVVACTRAALRRRMPAGSASAPAQQLAVERSCAARADRECPLGVCALVVDQERRQLAALLAELRPPPPPPSAPPAAAPPPPPPPPQSLVEFARDALVELYGARPADYARRLCRGAAAAGQVAAAGTLGDALSRRGAMPTRVVSRGTHEVVFGAGDGDKAGPNAAQVRVRFGNLTGERLCLASVEALGPDAVSAVRR